MASLTKRILLFWCTVILATFVLSGCASSQFTHKSGSSFAASDCTSTTNKIYFSVQNQRLYLWDEDHVELLDRYFSGNFLLQVGGELYYILDNGSENAQLCRYDTPSKTLCTFSGIATDLWYQDDSFYILLWRYAILKVSLNGDTERIDFLPEIASDAEYGFTPFYVSGDKITGFSTDAGLYYEVDCNTGDVRQIDPVRTTDSLSEKYGNIKDFAALQSNMLEYTLCGDILIFYSKEEVDTVWPVIRLSPDTRNTPPQMFTYALMPDGTIYLLSRNPLRTTC